MGRSEHYLITSHSEGSKEKTLIGTLQFKRPPCESLASAIIKNQTPQVSKPFQCAPLLLTHPIPAAATLSRPSRTGRAQDSTDGLGVACLDRSKIRFEPLSGKLGFSTNHGNSDRILFEMTQFGFFSYSPATSGEARRGEVCARAHPHGDVRHQRIYIYGTRIFLIHTHTM